MWAKFWVVPKTMHKRGRGWDVGPKIGCPSPSQVFCVETKETRLLRTNGYVLGQGKTEGGGLWNVHMFNRGANFKNQGHLGDHLRAKKKRPQNKKPDQNHG